MVLDVSTASGEVFSEWIFAGDWSIRHLMTWLGY